MNHWTNKSKGWIFISHSSQDYEYVKMVRNYLEESGFSALMFYLKSLEDPKKSKLTQKLIDWEIEARNIFVLCNSKNAKKSTWVKDEIKYVESFPEKIYVEIDMEKLKYEKCTQLSKLDKLMRRTRLFLSYNYADSEIVSRVTNFLASNGFDIWDYQSSISIGDNWETKIKSAITDISKQGVSLVFISKNSINSRWVEFEINMLLEQHAWIVPILLDDIPIYQINHTLRNIQNLNITIGDFEENMQKLLMVIKHKGEPVNNFV